MYYQFHNLPANSTAFLNKNACHNLFKPSSIFNNMNNPILFRDFKKITSSFLTFFLFILISSTLVLSQSYYPSPSPSSYQTSYQISSNTNKIDPKISEKLKQQSSINAIVELYDEPFSKDAFLSYKEKIKTKEEDVLSTLSNSDFTFKVRYKTIPGFAGVITQSGLNKLSSNTKVKYIYLDSISHTLLSESVPLINADDVHNIELSGTKLTGNGQVVCVIDTGVDYTHPALGGCLGSGCKVAGGYDFVNSDDDPMDDADDSHGTHIAGIIAAKGSVTGVSPDAKLLAVKVCRANGSCPNSLLVAGADWCMDHKSDLGTNIITMSIGGSETYDSNTCPNSGFMETALSRAHSLDIPFTIASGNKGIKNGIAYPACSPNAISVGAVYDSNVGSFTACLNADCSQTCTDSATAADKVTCYSNTADILDFVAPGTWIRSTIRNGLYDNRFGTSQATPHVAGVIALMKQYNPSLTIDQIISILKENSPHVIDLANSISLPRVDALALFKSLGCYVPGNGESIKTDIKLCPLTYSLSNGIKLNANNIVLDCNDALLKGTNKIGTGLLNSGFDGATIKNCNIQDYDKGILISTAANNNNIESNNIKNNNQGITMRGSQSNKINSNSITDNLNGIVLESSSNDNGISNNDITNNGEYNLKNNQNTPINSLSNWWGTKYDLGIDYFLFDFLDSASLGRITFSPFLSAPLFPPANNNPPILSNIENKEIQVNQQLQIQLLASDTDNDKLRFNTDANKILPQGSFTFDPKQGMFNFNPNEKQAGSYTITFEVSDGYLTDEKTIKITVKDTPFIRGDSNADSVVDISDAVNTLNVLFKGQGTFPCEDAADANDDGIVDISDAVKTLLVLFDSQTMPSPYPDRGLDATQDELHCANYTLSPEAAGGGAGVAKSPQDILNDPNIDQAIKDVIRPFIN